ncbi:hypothetical protein P43SY_007960 [Pythium insidiosum]|uniref:Transmembrane protein n=1 Tax=Pythium insidiosum TaxID=114742 RepID=A0AAD5QBK1_PYTIN|nr:hypothetical protein P43SY_007960 [Pythium insidiosum]
MAPSQSARRVCTAGPLVYGALWLVVVALHVICVVFPCLVASLYLYLPTHAPRIVKNAELYSVAVDRKYFKLIAMVYLVIAFVHTSAIVSILRSSVRYRRLLLHDKRGPGVVAKIKGVAVQPIVGSQQGSRGHSARSDSRLRSYTQQVVSSAKAVLSAFDVTNGYYDFVHMLRELVETCLLSYQAYQTSYLVARPWMNNMLVLLLILNCWSTPLIRSRLARQVYVARLFGLLVNIALDLMAYMVVPLGLFLPFYEIYEDIRTNASNNFCVYPFLVGNLYLRREEMLRLVEARPRSPPPREPDDGDGVGRLSVSASASTTKRDSHSRRNSLVALLQDSAAFLSAVQLGSSSSDEPAPPPARPQRNGSQSQSSGAVATLLTAGGSSMLASSRRLHQLFQSHAQGSVLSELASTVTLSAHRESLFQIYETQYARVLRETGEADLSIVVDRFLTFHESLQRLQQIERELGAEHSALESRRQRQQQLVQRLRFSGIAEVEKRKRIRDFLEQQHYLKGLVKAQTKESNSVAF